MKIDFVVDSPLIRYILVTMTRAVVALIHQKNQVLVCRRKKGSLYELKWEFPGGKMEDGESTLDCLKRELREELSIEIDAYDRCETRVNSYEDGRTFEVTYCFVSHFTGTPKNKTFEQIAWVSLDELHAMDMLSGNKPFVALLRNEDLTSS
jgi:mutator protein MutT